MELLDGVKQEMLQPEYWTDDYNLIMDAEAIRNFNRKIISDDTYRRFSLQTGELPTEEERRKFVLYNLNRQKELPQKAEIKDQIEGGLVQFGSEYKYGICVKRDAIMSLPLSGTWPERKFFTLSPIHINEGAIIYSETKDKEWLFVRTGTYYGWVKKDSIALCHSRDEMLEYSECNPFLVVTGESLQIPFDKADSGVIKYDMGDRIEIIDEDTDHYFINVFYAEKDGYAAKKKGIVPKKADVHKGYLCFSKATLISECLKCLGTGYKYGGGEGQRDCSSIIMEIFSVFGIRLPRNSAWQSKIPLKSFDLSNLEIKDKCSILDLLPTGALLFMESHDMVYLGKRESEHFIFHNVSNICQKNDGIETNEYGTTICSIERTYSLKKGCWLNLLTKAIVFGSNT